MRILKHSHSAEKFGRRTLYTFLTFISLQNIKKLEGGPFGDDKKISKRVSQFRKKIERGPYSLVRYCRLRLKSLTKRKGTLCTKFPLAALGFSSFGSFCKKCPLGIHSVM